VHDDGVHRYEVSVPDDVHVHGDVPDAHVHVHEGNVMVLLQRLVNAGRHETLTTHRPISNKERLLSLCGLLCRIIYKNVKNSYPVPGSVNPIFCSYSSRYLAAPHRFTLHNLLYVHYHCHYHNH